MERRRATMAGAALLTMALGFVPVEFTPGRGIETNDACGQNATPDQTPVTGTCCRQAEAACVAGEHAIDGYYYIKSGPCPS
jgi:hypothetical protein